MEQVLNATDLLKQMEEAKIGTFVYPSELFPVRGRTTGHGIAAATGKLGASVGVFMFPVLSCSGMGCFQRNSLPA